jgi:hypothetical protein
MLAQRTENLTVNCSCSMCSLLVSIMGLLIDYWVQILLSCTLNKLKKSDRNLCAIFRNSRALVNTVTNLRFP